jgi:hypothetical protein
MSKFVGRILFMSTCFLRKSFIISVLLEAQSSFYVCFIPNKMPCQLHITQIYSAQYLSYKKVAYHINYNISQKMHMYIVDLC